MALAQGQEQVIHITPDYSPRAAPAVQKPPGPRSGSASTSSSRTLNGPGATAADSQQSSAKGAQSAAIAAHDRSRAESRGSLGTGSTIERPKIGQQKDPSPPAITGNIRKNVPSNVGTQDEDSSGQSGKRNHWTCVELAKEGGCAKRKNLGYY